MHIYVSMPDFDSQHHDRLRQLAADDHLHLRGDYTDDDSIESSFTQCEVVFGNVPAHWVAASNSLRWLQLESVGFGEYRELDLNQREPKIWVTNLAGFFADPVAQTALAGILAHYRGIDSLTLFRERKHWEGDPIRIRLRSLSNANVVLFGYGTINQRLQQLLEPFDCAVTTFGRNWQDAQLNEALKSADIVVSTVPETDTTLNVFDSARLALLGTKTLFVNCGRGSAVDEPALALALKTGKLGGAVLDVTVDEPLPKDNVLWTTPNTILTQHSGGGTPDELDRKIDVFARNLKHYRSGEALSSVADFKRGY